MNERWKLNVTLPPVKRYFCMVWVLAALIVLSWATSQAGVASDSASASVGHEDAVISYLRPALRYAGGAVRIYYAGECRAAEYDTSGKLQLLFPPVVLQAPLQGATGVDAVRQIFRNDANVVVTQDRSGMVRIMIGSVPTALLQTRVQALTLNPYDQYSALSALFKIEDAPELDAAERRLDVYPVPFQIIDIILSGPIPGKPHLPKLMQNVTIDEALDSMVRTFEGIVMYGICKRPGGKYLFILDYTYGS